VRASGHGCTLSADTTRPGATRTLHASTLRPLIRTAHSWQDPMKQKGPRGKPLGLSRVARKPEAIRAAATDSPANAFTVLSSKINVSGAPRRNLPLIRPAIVLELISHSLRLRPGSCERQPGDGAPGVEQRQLRLPPEHQVSQQCPQTGTDGPSTSTTTYHKRVGRSRYDP